MNDERRPARNTAAQTNRDTAYRAWSMLDELERERFLGVDPRCSRVWPSAPAMLKRDFCDGYIDADSFWSQLRRWTEFEERGASGVEAA